MRLARLALALALVAATPGLRAQESAPASPSSTATRLAGEAAAAARQVLDTVLQRIESKGGSLGTTAEQELVERRELARSQLDQAEGLRDRLSALPDPEDTVDFLTTREALEQLLERRRNERDLQVEKTKLALESEDAHQARLARQTAAHLVAQVEVLEAALAELEADWRATYPDPEAREAAEAAAREAIARAKADEEEAVRTRALEESRALEEARKEAEELAAKARAELEEASTEEETELAQLRLTFATLDGEAEKLRVDALQAEVRAREAERELEAARARLAKLVPELLRADSDPARVAREQAALLREAARLQKEADLLQTEVDQEQEEIPALRERVQELTTRFDELDEGLDARRADPSYRRMVYFARQAYRAATQKLDQYRTMVEFKEHRQEMLERHAVALREGAARLEGRAAATFLGQTFEQWAHFFLALLAAVVLSLVADVLFRGVFTSIAHRTRWDWDDIALEELRSPVRVLVLVAGGYLAIGTFRLTDAGGAVVSLAFDALGTLWVGFLCWRLLNLVSRILEPRISDSESKLDDQLLRFLRRGLRFVILAVTGVFVLEAFGWKVTSVLAGLGLGGLAFALAAKDTLANLFGSIMLFADRPFQVGNWVIVDGVEGVVEDIGIRSTRIRTFKDTIVTMPNATVANASAENIHSFRKRRLYFTLTLRLDTPTAKVSKVVDDLRDILTDHPMVLDGHYVYMTSIKENGLEVMTYCFVGTRDWREWMHHSQDIYLQVLEMLEDNGVSLAFPTHTVEFEKGSPFDRLHASGEPMPGSAKR